MPDLRTLIDRMEIADKLALWCEIADTGKIEKLDEVFMPDIDWDFGDGRAFHSIQDLSRTMQANMLSSPRCGATMHNISNIVVEVTGDSASSKANCLANHEGLGPYAGDFLVLWLTYTDRWTRTEHGWRIAQRVYRWKLVQGPEGIVHDKADAKHYFGRSVIFRIPKREFP